MKKLICVLLALCLMLALVACGSKDVSVNNADNSAVQSGNDQNGADDQAASDNVTSEPGFVFTYKGVDITMNAPAADIVSALGEPKNYTEEASCAFDGLDKTYYFGSFYMQTYPMDDIDYVYCLWLVDDSITTQEGIYIGASEAEVKAAYGEENYNGTNAYMITKGDSKLTVIIENGVVSSIQYDAIVI